MPIIYLLNVVCWIAVLIFLGTEQRSDATAFRPIIISFPLCPASLNTPHRIWQSLVACSCVAWRILQVPCPRVTSSCALLPVSWSTYIFGLSEAFKRSLLVAILTFLFFFSNLEYNAHFPWLYCSFYYIIHFLFYPTTRICQLTFNNEAILHWFKF